MKNFLPQTPKHMMKKLSILSLLVTLTSCGVYKSDFDCRPGKGIGCAPVGEVLDLIVEKEEGEDLFVKDKGTALLLKQDQKEKLIKTSNKTGKKYYLVQDSKGDWKLVQLKEKKAA